MDATNVQDATEKMTPEHNTDAEVVLLRFWQAERLGLAPKSDVLAEWVARLAASLTPQDVPHIVEQVLDSERSGHRPA